MKKALIVVDVQNDFCEGGALAVTGAGEIIPYINALMEYPGYDEIVLTQDWHPVGHGSFASTNGREPGEVIELDGIAQVMWPDHCVQGSRGAAFHPELNCARATYTVQKGKHPQVDSYSGFQDNHGRIQTELDDFLKSRGIGAVEIAGLALDYCVKYTCLDAVARGYATALHFRGTRAVNVAPSDGRDTVYLLLEKGVPILA